ncbi:MAG: alpha/beta hydrolase [Chitinophagaceae bacterium]|nr:alpha/beta hydrolase [Chitinophagaceae bacterium]MCW5928361.1 alpha/beta hydrolase [Chitinophagaceae bacterium]
MKKNSTYVRYLLSLFAFILSLSGYTQTEQDFVYKIIKGHEIKATVFYPEHKEKLPVAIYFHGGGFMFGNRNEIDANLKKQLLNSGFAVISADYRLAPESQLNEILTDAGDIIKWVKRNGKKKFNIDTKRIAVIGGSAGGYLALSTGFNKKYKPNTIVAISAPTGFSTGDIKTGDINLLKQPGIVQDTIVSHGDYDKRMELWRYLGKNQLALYAIFGFDPATEPQKLKLFTLTDNITTDYPSLLLLQAKNDRLVNPKDVQFFQQLLQERKVNSEMVIVENGHGSELIRQNPDSIEKIIQFLNIHFNRK